MSCGVWAAAGGKEKKYKLEMRGVRTRSPRKPVKDHLRGESARSGTS